MLGASNENQNSSARDQDLCAASPADRLLMEISELLVARTAGAEVIQPLPDVCEPQLAESNASKHFRVRASHAPRIWKLTRETSC
jgi:hypothetical protein